MEGILLYEKMSDNLLLLAISTARVAMAFLITPLFSEKLIPPLVRNSIFVAFSIYIMYLQPVLDFNALTALQLLGIFAKEVFIGVAIGFFFGLFLWAFESAGVVIDTQIGASMARIYDPISGHSVTLYGELFGRWINYLFLSSGGLLLLTVAVMESYSIWPLNQAFPALSLQSVTLFEDIFGQYFGFVLALSAPLIAIMFLVDMCMGLMNRFAKRLDVFFITMAIKGLVALLLVLILIPVLLEMFLAKLDVYNHSLPGYLQQLQLDNNG